MKKLIIISALVATVGINFSCTDNFFEIEPQGAASLTSLSNKNGVNALLIGTYSLMDGVGAGNTGRQSTISNYVFGGITSGDAVKGTDIGDQPEQEYIEQFNWLSDNTYFLGKWQHTYDGVARANETILLAKSTDVKDMTDAERTQVVAEARFLRGHYHFEGKKMWNNVPYIDETIYKRDDPNSTKIPNDKDIWSNIEADFKFAADNLPATQAQKGRATKWAAMTYLAKSYIYQKKWAAAKTLLLDVYANSGKKLMPNYHDNYRNITNNNAESIFEVEFSVNDGSTGNNGNAGDNLNWPYSANSPGRGCCGFYLPSQNLVNAFKTDADGLPMIGDKADGTADTYNSVDVPNDQGLKSNVAFDLKKDVPVDPRLDWTVGRRGVKFLDWGVMPGYDWIRNQNYSGPYIGKKWMYYLADEGSSTHSTNKRAVNNNYRLLKMSSVILWLAECEVELGNLAQAETYVNLIRNRAKTGSVQDASVTYSVNPYPAGTFAAKGVDYARNALRMENRLEFAMEGHRFFDLVRWGIAESYLNKYLKEESVNGTDLAGRTYNKRGYLVGKTFKAGRNEYFPLPNDEILNSQKNGAATLKQNPGY
ncbi:RagB/SusD family nutrient uptake outer membrane protein [Aquirufa antheringensis]|uniref:RagB/SusD family nutrient uptake outer membrane protein n=1 Tax=Aquirufa antheringensis TaxID=2516559 RepID=UPI0022A831E6|nr:RagB/SusD family nutrient uptake outer membrane protein [Aquirufa antheringensis]MCZ2488184.1 RagB/SusD family nutrient uptake outer membrane protein [Aquirufa antheringensis]MCZ2490274.1 RagB/SusD family nutrient uptake outer membrane protein [Aquirufa antheringensis]